MAGCYYYWMLPGSVPITTSSSPAEMQASLGCNLLVFDSELVKQQRGVPNFSLEISCRGAREERPRRMKLHWPICRGSSAKRSCRCYRLAYTLTTVKGGHVRLECARFTKRLQAWWPGFPDYMVEHWAAVISPTAAQTIFDVIKTNLRD